jgi:hypothetical protein
MTDGALPLMVSGLEALDDLRRGAGQVLDALGHGPRTTPSIVTDPAPGARLHSYPGADPSGPPLLLVPAPIKRCYIFDLDPACSVVARCLRHGLQPHLVEWTDPGPEEQRLGLDAYGADLLGRCLRAVTHRTGSPASRSSATPSAARSPRSPPPGTPISSAGSRCWRHRCTSDPTPATWPRSWPRPTPSPSTPSGTACPARC